MVDVVCSRLHVCCGCCRQTIHQFDLRLDNKTSYLDVNNGRSINNLCGGTNTKNLHKILTLQVPPFRHCGVQVVSVLTFYSEFESRCWKRTKTNKKRPSMANCLFKKRTAINFASLRRKAIRLSQWPKWWIKNPAMISGGISYDRQVLYLEAEKVLVEGGLAIEEHWCF